MINLSTSQQEIVQSDLNRSVQILASAGAGKTRVLTERIRYILENTKKDGVIALTFTNKAAEEMQERLEEIEEVSERCWIATIHSIAQRVLEQYGHTIGLPPELHIYERDQDRKSLFLQSLREGGVDVDSFLDVSDSREKKERDRKIQTYMENFSIIKRELLTEEEVKSEYTDSVWDIFQAYQKALIESNGIDFDDILVYSQKILLEQPWCAQIYRAKFKHICVDEAQDLNKAQYEFIRALCGDEIKSVLMVGDPNQMIYGFNGSSHEYLCKHFVEDFKPIQYELKENFRSSQAVISLANKLKPNSQVVSDFAIIGKGEISSHHNEESEAQWICSKILELLNLNTSPDIEGVINLAKMVVIARNRFVFGALEEELKTKQIPYFLKKGERQDEPSSMFGKVLDLAIRLKLNPKDWVDGRKLCNLLKVTQPSIWGDSRQLATLSSVAQTSGLPFGALFSDVLTWVDGLDNDSPNIPKLAVYFLNSLEGLAHVSTSDTEREELARSLQELEAFKKCWLTFKKRGLGNSLASFRNAMALGQLSEDQTLEGLTLSTVHTMKGLEKDVVFLMGMCEGVFPDYRATLPKQLEEERNNAFVAVTRARRWIYITYPLKRKMPWGDTKAQVPSRFIRDMNTEVR